MKNLTDKSDVFTFKHRDKNALVVNCSMSIVLNVLQPCT